MLPPWKDLCEYPFEALRNSDPSLPIALDTETAGSTDETNTVCYYSWAADDLGSGGGPSFTQDGFRFMYELFNSPRPKIFHNLKADLEFCRKSGIDIKGPFHDTIYMHALLYPGPMEDHGLKLLALTMLHQDRSDAAKLAQQQRYIPKGMRNLRTPQEMLHRYAVQDTIDTLGIYKTMLPELVDKGLWKLYVEEVQTTLCYWLLDRRGVEFNTEEATKSLATLQQALDDVQNAVAVKIGKKINLGSPQQLGSTLIEQGIPLTERTKTGYATSADILKHFKQYELVRMVLGYKYLASAKRGLKMFNSKVQPDGRLHPDYHALVKSGRSSCSGVPLQSIPKQRTWVSELEVGDAVLAEKAATAFQSMRRCFRAAKGAIILACDYSQVEYLFAAHYMDSPRIFKLLDEKGDFHEVTSLLVFGDHNKQLRMIIKIINYGLLYGMGIYELQEQLYGLSKEPARVVLDRYEKALPEMRDFQRKVTYIGERNGAIRDVFGRYYPFEPEAPHKLVANLCQGSAAKVKKLALCRLTDLFFDRRSGVIMDIHDDLPLEIYPEDEHLIPQIPKLMTDVSSHVTLKVQLKVDMEYGPNLLDLEKYEGKIDWEKAA